MTDREKLIELLLLADPNPYECEEQSGSCELTTCTQCRAENTANILLSNGAVVRDKGEWITDGRRTECSQCHNEKSGGSQPEWYKFMEFCPDCGADLRRKNDI